MSAFSASLSNELYKLRKHKKYWVLPIIVAAVNVLIGVGRSAINLIEGMEVSKAALMGGFAGSHLTFLLMVFLPLLAMMAACDLYAGEYSDRTIRACLMRPVSKGKIFLSKAAAVFILCTIELFALYLIAAVTQLVLGGTAKGIGIGALDALIDLIPMAVLILFFCLLNQFLKGTSLTFFISLVAYIGLLAVGTYFNAAGGMLFTGYLRWHNLWVGTALPFLSMLPRIGMILGYGVVFYCGGYLLFERKEA